MKKQVVVIHGGDYRRSEKRYIAELKKEPVEPEDFKRPESRWKDRLQEALGNSFEVFNPKMPIPENASYAEWKIWFDKLVPFLKKGVILVGHSLGAIFLAKYLSENKFPIKIAGVILLAGPYELLKKNDKTGGFAFKKDFDLLSRQGGRVILYHSKDDEVVPFSDFEKYRKNIPGAELRIFSDKGHFRQRDFPEVVKDIIEISA
jgi:predicted alpha/beta hydrolase family esterase